MLSNEELREIEIDWTVGERKEETIPTLLSHIKEQQGEIENLRVMSTPRPISEAKKDGKPVLGLSDWGWEIYRWERQTSSRNPNPYWAARWGPTTDRQHQPTIFLPMPNIKPE